MAESQITHTLVGQTGMTPSFVNQNFRDVAQFVNTQTVHSDGTNLPGFLPLGLIGLAEDDSDTHEETDLTADIDASLVVAFTAPGGRRYRISGSVSGLQDGGGGGGGGHGDQVSAIYEDGSFLALLTLFSHVSNGHYQHHHGACFHVPAAGAVSYSLRLATDAGTVDAVNDIFPAWIAVEDVGPS
jgi:hypothetical protein